MAIILFIILWLLIGCASWLSTYYGTIKYWHLAYEEDFRTSESSRLWRRSFIVIFICGPLSIIAMLLTLKGSFAFKHGITLYYKVPDGTKKSPFNYKDFPHRM